MNILKKHIKKLRVAVVALIAAAFFALGTTAYHDFEISKNLDIFATLFRQLNSNYTDEINPGRLTKTAIDAMLESLDPYTVYIPEADIEDYRIAQSGHSGSVGFTVNYRDGQHVIAKMNRNSSAVEEGLLVGDIILKIDNNSLKNRSAEEVNFLLNGQAGTIVNVMAKRPFINELIKVDLERRVIREQTIPWSGLPNDRVAYISLGSFTQTAAADVKEAYLKLTSENDVEGVILDLRGNGGGLLIEAVKIANFFVKQNEIISSIRGRVTDKNRTYRTGTSPIDMEIPVVILIDNISASASEIVAGALQDLDRAVVIGQTSYGKGLVQNIVPLSYNSQLKVTIAKYYIPSGRCIQSIDHSDINGTKNIPDSLLTEFSTRNGRTVLDGKGIIPDIVIPKPELSPVVNALLNNYIIFDFATSFRIINDSIPPANAFSLNDDIWNEFVEFVDKQEFQHQSSSEDLLAQLNQTLKSEGYYEYIKKDLMALKNSLDKIKKEDLERYKDEIWRLLEKEIVYRYYFEEGKILASLQTDEELIEAYSLLEDKNRFLRITAGGYRPL